MTKIIGVSGTHGAGKDEIANHLIEKHGFFGLTVRGYLQERLKELGRPENRDTMYELGNELRKDHGGDFIVKELLAKARSSKAERIVISSIRTEDEVRLLEQEGGTLFFVDADPKIRFERIQKRASSTDEVGYLKFLEDEERESVSKDPAVQNLRRCKELALPSFIFTNDESLELLFEKQIDPTVHIVAPY